MIINVARYFLKPGCTPQMFQAFEEMRELTLQNEPGCLFYQVSQSLEDEHYLILYENYADKSALEAHKTTSYFKDIIESRVLPWLERREREIFELRVG